MEIDIKENRAKTKTAGKTEVEKMIDRAKTTKEPPFYPELEKALLRITPSPKTEAEATKALREPSRLLRDAVQYYNNRLVDPEKVIDPRELTIIAVAADLLHRTLEKTITDGGVGEGTAYFYSAIAALSTTIGAAGCLSRDGKSVDYRLNPEEIEKKLDKLEGGSDNVLELIRRKSAHFFDLLKKVGGRDMSETAFQMEVVKKVGQGDPKALEMLDKLADIEDAWLKYTKLDNLRSTNGAIQILILLLERYSRRMRAEMGNEGFELLELLDAMAFGTCINQKDGGRP